MGLRWRVVVALIGAHPPLEAKRSVDARIGIECLGANFDSIARVDGLRVTAADSTA